MSEHPYLIAAASRHVEGKPQHCDCGRSGCDGQTFCEWCENEWPCLTRQLADALEAAVNPAKAWHEGFCRGEVSGGREFPINPHAENPYR